MSNGNENPDDSDTPSERESLPADFDCPVNAPVESLARDIEDEADQRGELDGITEDGLSPVYLTGAFRFVTPCHDAEVGLRASKICPACSGNLDKPVETAIPLSCGHFAAVNFASGDRLTPCPTCGEPSIVRAEQVITTRFIAREATVTEQLQFMGLQTP